jgi:AcrR family transcriptional regulator
MATTRQTREGRKAQTRADLVSAARRVFLERGFHRATLDEIADAAGYTKGAVYSNFDDKDALFLAVLEAHYARRSEAYRGIILDGESLEETVRAISRFMGEADAREPDWLPLLAEFIAHAARHEPLRASYRRVREAFLAAVADTIAALGERHGVSFRVAPRDVARGSSILARGFRAERQLDPTLVSPALFEELHTAYVLGLAIPERRDK